jgi:thiol:disulfide interchange protein
MTGVSQPTPKSRGPAARPWLAAWLATIGCAILAAGPARAEDFLPPEQAYEYAVEAHDRSLLVTYNIRDGYYLYRKRIGFATDTPGVTLGAAEFPKGLPHSDEYFGEQEIYRGSATFRVPYTLAAGRAPAAVDLKLKLQGCADAGLCYPPQTWTTRVMLQRQLLLRGSTTAGDGILPVDEAYHFSAEPAGSDTLRLRFVIADGYYLYRARMKVAGDDALVRLGAAAFPQGVPHEDDFFGQQEVYRQQVEALVPFTRVGPGAGSVRLKVSYQGCADAGLCYPLQTRELTVAVAAAAGEAGTAGAAPAGPALPILLGLAMLGGLLLNLMPCVLPVLSIKALSLAATTDRRAARLKGLAYTAGVLASMLALAGTLLALRAAGEQIGWGFQLQSPGFVLALCYLVLLVGLNLSGVFEVGATLAGAGDELARGDGARASFFTGVLTTLVATPCTAPFMATAVGVALTQSAAKALAVFVALGLGLALPYIVLALTPAARRYLPRPGAWMVRFKQALAFPMYASAGWLLWIVAQQSGPVLLAAAIAGFVLVALAAWCYELSKSASRGWRRFQIGVAVASLAVAVALPLGTEHSGAPGATAKSQARDGFEPFAAARVAALVASGRPVLVVFTADWCVTCKVNEAIAFGNDGVRRLIRAKGVALLEADLTNENPVLSAELARHGRAGVPLYLFYRPGVSRPEVLPQLLTPGTIRDRIAALPESPSTLART